jgi:hypothetical protein
MQIAMVHRFPCPHHDFEVEDISLTSGEMVEFMERY